MIIENPQGTLEYSVELHGTTQISFQLHSNVTEAQNRVVLVYDVFSLVQNDDFTFASLYTMDITITGVTTTAPTTTTSTGTTTNSTSNGFETFVPIILAGGGIVLVLVLVILYKKKQ